MGDGDDTMFAKVLDQTRCIGCHACTTACKSENEVPLSVSRTYVKSVDAGTFPAVRREFQVTRCNQCDDAPCVAICPTAAMFRRSDGIVDVDKRACIGCKACIAACPYDAVFINPEDGSAEKCNLCAHRLEVGLEPACVVVCPVEAIIVGDLDDPSSAVARTVAREPVTVRRPEKGTRPKVFYRGAGQRTLDPLAAQLPAGGLFAWAQQPPESAHHVNTGARPGHGTTSQAAAIVSYDVAHAVPWDWRVGLYTWTKSIAAGAYLAALVLLLTGTVGADDALWRWAAPLVGLAFLAATGAVLVWDLEHPGRVHHLVTRPQWRSWLVRGGAILTGYGAVLTAHLGLVLLGRGSWTATLAIAGAPLATATAVYTALLLAQARGRDLWQSPLLAPHLAVQALLAGSAVVLLAAPWLDGTVRDAAGRMLTATAALHLLLVLGEVAVVHPTAHARTAVHNLTSGPQRRPFRAGAALVVLGLAAAWTPLVAPAALLGLALHEHAYVQAGQSVPLA
jgi:Fe-S-cluster-containing dehydrogenase component/formate-dependent nitrite reductase membrane component NrfD